MHGWSTTKPTQENVRQRLSFVTESLAALSDLDDPHRTLVTYAQGPAQASAEAESAQLPEEMADHEVWGAAMAGHAARWPALAR